MKIQVHLFARAKDLIGASLVQLELPEGATVGDLRRGLAERYPNLRSLLQRSALAVAGIAATPTSTAATPIVARTTFFILRVISKLLGGGTVLRWATVAGLKLSDIREDRQWAGAQVSIN